jgi:transglycosylase-like protein with SLT domain/LysM domain-containing protein
MLIASSTRMKNAHDGYSVLTEEIAERDCRRIPHHSTFHRQFYSYGLRQAVRDFMAAHRENLLLVLVVLGVVGCSNTERLYYRPSTISPISSKLNFPVHSFTGSSVPLSSNPSLTANVDQEPMKEVVAKPSIRDEIPAHVLKHFERQTEIVESREKLAPPPLAASTVQTAPGQLADNRLLELLQKDLDKAVEQPKERRRLQFSKDVVDNPKVRHFIKHYTTTAKDQFQTVLARTGKFMPMISKVLIDEGLPEELAYLALVESELIVSARSQVGAVGLWQFVPATARQYGLRIDQWVDERRDPIKSTRAAAAYLKELHSYYGRWYLVTAAYNAGPGIINKALQSSHASDFWEIKGKAQLREETRNFVPKFIATALIATDPKKYGFTNIPYQDPLEFDEVEAEGLLKIDALAEMAESDAMTIKDLNPALLRNLTPPGEKGYPVRVPVGKSAVFAKANDDLKGKVPDSGRVVTHQVKRGETLVSIARYYGQAVKSLMQLNGLTTQRLKIGQQIKVFFDGMRGSLR